MEFLAELQPISFDELKVCQGFVYGGPLMI